MSEPCQIWPFVRPPLPKVALFSHCLSRPIVGADNILATEDWLGSAALQRRIEFAAGRVCAWAALRELGGYRGSIQVARPHRYPKFPTGFVGSISHTKTLAVSCAAEASSYLGIGVDIETISEHQDFREMARYIMSASEMEIFNGMEQKQALLFFHRCFSAKEAFFKAIFPICHVYMDFKESELIAWCDDGSFTLRLLSSRINDYFPDGALFNGLWSVFQDAVVTLLPVSKHANKG
ncbi:4'-phosphopantetheinyl transferase [Vibrio mimicus VM223]|nr:4'-phosphopantetheinyl transferase [Vibrio mimicus VM223]